MLTVINGNRMKSERKRSPRDFYQTPLDLATASLLALNKDERIFDLPRLLCLDAGCGTGVWGQAMVLSYMDSDGLTIPENFGIDLQPNVTLDPIPYMGVFSQDFLLHYPTLANEYNIVFGNPPYSLAEEFVRHAYWLVGLNGYVFFLLRLSFLEGIRRCRGLYKDVPLKRVYVCSRRPSFFSSDGKRKTTDTLAYGMFLWQKGYRGQPTISFLDWDYKGDCNEQN